jgi:hypothetical protein
MATSRRRRTHLKYIEKPQDYEHRVEIAIEALFHATAGIEMIVRFLREQQSPDWRDTQMLDTAAGDFRNAIRWLRKRLAFRTIRRTQRLRHRGK